MCIEFCADVDVEKPDEKSIMTYVAQFLKGYHDVGGASVSFDSPSLSYVLLTYLLAVMLY